MTLLMLILKLWTCLNIVIWNHLITNHLLVILDNYTDNSPTHLVTEAKRASGIIYAVYLMTITCLSLIVILS